MVSASAPPRSLRLKPALGAASRASNVACALSIVLVFSAEASAQFSQQGPKLVGTGAVGTAAQGLAVALSADGNTAIVGAAGDNAGAGAAWVWKRTGALWAQQGPKLVGSGAIGTARQGSSVAVSADGNTAVVGGPGDSSSTGAMWVWTRIGGVWTQQGPKLVGSGAVGGAQQGAAVSLSADGNTAAVGGPADNVSFGAVWVWTRVGSHWVQQGPKLVASGTFVVPAFQGAAVGLSADAGTLIVAGPQYDAGMGAAWVWVRSGGVWTQQGPTLRGPGIPGVRNVQSVALSGEGGTAVVGEPFVPSPNGVFGGARIWTRNGTTWTRQDPPLVGAGGHGGESVNISVDGNTAVVGGPSDNGGVGATWVWRRTSGSWTQIGQKLVGSGAAGSSEQGGAVSVSADGNTVLAGGPSDDADTGAAWVFFRDAGPWPLQITTSTLAGGTIGKAYGQGLQATGGQPPYVWSASGALPPGLSLNSTVGSIYGTPTAAGTFSFSVTVQDGSNPPQSATGQVSIIVGSQPPLSIATSSLQPATVGTAYGQGLTATDGKAPYTWSVSSGLPPGLAVNSGAGAILGTPTAAGTFGFTVTVRDSGIPPQTALKALSMTAVQPTVPSVPSSLTAVWIGGQVSLAWRDTSSNEAGFKVERRLDPPGTYSQVALRTANQNNYSDATVATANGYCYRVRATNAVGDSPFSNEACVPGATGTAGQQLRFSSPTYAASGPGDWKVTVTRPGGTTGSGSVWLLVSNGTAVLGADYSVITDRRIVFGPGDASHDVIVRVYARPPSDRTLNLELSQPSGSVTLGTPSRVVFTIQGQPPGPPGAIEMFDAACDRWERCVGPYFDSAGYLSRSVDQLENLTAAREGAVADGVTLLLLRVQSATPVTFRLTLGGTQAPAAYGTLLKRDGTAESWSVRADSELSLGVPTAYALYKAPLDLPPAAGTLRIEADNGLGTAASKPVKLSLPPVVLVHGIWSDWTTFTSLATDLRSRGHVTYEVDYSEDSAGSFDPSRPSVPIYNLARDTATALSTIRYRSIAASQVDVVAHSMGGLVARARATGTDASASEPYRRRENRFKGEFHKLITLGSPHQGTRLAEWLVQHKNDPLGPLASLEQLFLNLGLPLGPAVHQMQPAQAALSRLNLADVPTHTIAGREPGGTGSERFLNVVFKWAYHPFTTIDSLLGGQGEHDLIVPVASALAGRSSTTSVASELNGAIHTDLTDDSSDQVFTQTAQRLTLFPFIDQLLRTATHQRFAPVSVPSTVGSPVGESTVEPVVTGAARVPTAGSGVLTPGPGTVVRPGDEILVTLTAPDAGVPTQAAIAIGGGMRLIDGMAGAFVLPYRVPMDAAGDIMMFATTLDAGAGTNAVSSYITVLPSVQPDELSVDPGAISLLVAGATAKLRVKGIYSDGTTINLGSSTTGTTYSTASGTGGVVTVSADGVVDARASGTDTIVIRNGSLVAAVSVSVNFTNRRPQLAPLSDRTIRPGESVDIPLAAVDPDGDQLDLTAVGLPAFASVIDNHDGTGVLRLRPGQNDLGAYSIGIIATDSGAPTLTNSTALLLRVSSASGPPIGVDDAYWVPAGASLDVSSPGVLGNDTQTGSDPLTATLGATAAGGTLSLAADGQFTYWPRPAFTGNDRFTYRPANFAGLGSPATVSINVAASGVPLPPVNLRVTAVVGNAVTLSWAAPSLGPATVGYQLEGGIAPGQVLGMLPLGPAPGTTVTLPNGSFYLRIRTIGVSAMSDPCADLLVHVNVPLPPSSPKNLLGLVVGDTLGLAWTNTFAGGPAARVNLTVSGAYTGTLPLSPADSFSFVGVPPGTYTFVVQASNESGLSAPSNSVTLTFPTTCSGPPEPVTNFEAYAVGRTVSLRWETAAGGPAPTTFVVIATGTLVGTVPTNLRRLSGVVPAGNYYVSVVATNACGASPPTPVQTVSVQ
jgi:Bacterial Ig domain/Putative Ig domain/Putative serine esterase (DUF676)